ncbi:non-ribosomal peptide synthetase [Nocardiopsis sp. CNT312]|uniref:non-ribosomal peptide synthetase n=1 Tax=Nocardiopsis sp. CNT312 TaxID=1137268 RepID=UPI00048B2DBD|nr:non-ribosomal peptide synthetase [Nocardiopsis sp. CNT312]
MSDRVVEAELTAVREHVARVLGTDRFADTDDLFDHGLDSLGLIRLVGHWREAGADVTFEELSRQPTAARWAALLARQERRPAPAEPVPDSSAPTGDASFPMATMQHAYWIGRGDEQPLGGVAAHFYTEFDGRGVDPDRLAGALESVVDRHPMLRARFDGDGHQRIAPSGQGTGLTVHDLRGASREDADRALSRMRDENTHRRLDVASGHVLDVALSLLPEGRTRLHVDLDMIVADALSLRVLLDDLRTAYEGGDLPTQDYDFASYLAERRSRGDGEVDRARTWWHERLRDLPPPPELPTVIDASRPTPAGSPLARSTRLHHHLSPERARALAQRARDAGVTPAAALATAFAEVLGAWSASPAFTLNLPLFDRAPLHPDVDRMIGDFSGSVLLAVDTSDTVSFADRARTVQGDLHAAVDHGAYGGVEVLRDLARLNGGAMTPSPVVYTSAIGLGPLFSDGVQRTFGTPVHIISQGPQVWLDAQVTELGGGLLLNWDLREHAFAPGTARAAFDAYRGLVESLVDDPDVWSRPFRPQIPAARDGSRDTAAVDLPVPAPRTLHSRFFEHARATPGAPALLGPDGSATAYGDLADRALRIAGAVAHRVPLGGTVALCLPRGVDQVAALLGILAAGCSYLPVGAHQPPARRAAILERGAPDLMISDDPAVLEGSPVPPLALARALEGPAAPQRETEPDALAYVLFTSGSTGAPKGVEVPHRAAAHTIDVLNGVLGTAPRDRTLALAEIEFDMSVFDLFAPLSVGASVLLAPSETRRDAAEWTRAAAQAGVTLLNCVPTLLDMLLTAVESGLAPPPPLRAVLLGGDRIGTDLPGRLRALAPGSRFLALGGMTEAAVHSTLLDVDEADPEWNHVPWGRPLPGVHCRVVDPQGRDRPDLVPGELWVGGAGLAHGYRGAPSTTADRFVHTDGRRWYRTGDRARYTPDGSLEFLGRLDHQVKVNGVRVESGEVEAALASHAGVASAVAVVLPGPSPVLAAALAPAAGADTEGLVEAATAHARTLLPESMVPAVLATVPGLPLTPNGKPDRRALTRLLSDRAAGAPQADAPPEGERESEVARLWSDLLGVPGVGRSSSFFALGGDSLLATRLVAALRERGYARASVADLFVHPRLSDFAAALPEKGQAVRARTLTHDAASRYEPFPPTGVQRAYLTGRDPEFTLGNVGTYHYTEFDGADVDLRRLERALDRLVARHDMLRAVFDDSGDQRVLPDVPPVRIPVTEADPADPGAALDALFADMSHQVLDPARWPLFDVRAVRYTDGAAERVRLGVGLDYLVLDALSIMTLYTELDLLYRDPDAALEPVEITFRDYLLQTRPDPERVARAEEYWSERVRDLPPAPALPLAADPTEVDAPRFVRRSDHLSPKEWRALAAVASAEGITPSTLLLACYGEILGAWSGQTRLSVTLTLFNRGDVHPHIGRVLGDFTSLSLTSYQREPGEDPLAAARALQHRLGEDLDHREVSAEDVLRELTRRDGTAQAGIPVVFTSSLGVGEGVSLDLSPEFPARVRGLSQSPQVHLDNQVLEHEGGLDVVWDAVEELFRPGALDAMFNAYLDLLRGLARGGARLWADLAAGVLPAAQTRVRASVNDTAAPRPEGALHDAFFAGADGRADTPALITAEGVLTHGRLAERSLRIAAGLVEHGVRPGDTVAVHLPKGADQICAVLGTLAAGAAYVPVGTGQPSLRRRRIHAAADTVVTIGADEAAPRSVDVSDLVEYPPLDAPVPTSAEATAYIIFTSGSTGEPKGVEVSHGAALNTVDDINGRHSVGPRDRVLALSSLDFDLSVYDVFGLLGAGGALVVPQEEERRDARRWLELCAEHRVTVWNTVPALLDMLLLAAQDKEPPSSLRLALVSGDWVGTDLSRRLRAANGDRTRLVAMGGATEAAIWSNAFDGGHAPPGWPSVPYGTPLRDQRYRVVDPYGRDCPDWVPGELWIGGAGVARGYRGDPERTAARFVTVGGERWYRTGDLGRYRPGGLLEFLGRTDRQVKVGGHRLELGEVEAALHDHPAVRRAAVVAVGKRASQRLAAFVVGQGRTPSLGELTAHLASRLPAHAVPGTVHAVEDLPLTPNGKVDTAALEGLAARRTHDRGAPPADGVEKRIAHVWEEVLGESVTDREANFFSLGGSSLLAIRMITVLRREMSEEISTRSFLAVPTLAALADQVRAASHEDMSTGVI